MRKVGLSILLFVLCVVAAFVWYSRAIVTPLNLNAPYQLSVKKGATLNGVAKQLEHDAVISRALLLKLYAKQNKAGHNIKAGEYLLEPGLNIPGLLQKLIDGKVALEQITIPEGMTFREMLSHLHKNSAIDSSLVDASDSEIMSAIGHADEHPEGRFLPETYRFAKGTSDVTLLKQAYSAMQNVLSIAWEKKSQDCELSSPYEALILASIIEKETGVFDEQATISGVFNSRLRKGMRLQTDPTVIYGMGALYNGNIRRKDLETDTPYNTYTRSGLPPTPIALPGSNAIMAAVIPEKHDKLYFVATGDGDGRHYFSSSYVEHQKAVQRYLRKYRQNNSKK